MPSEENQEKLLFYIKKHKLAIALTLLVFLVSFLIRIQGPLNHGYPIGWADSQVHTHRMLLLTRNPKLFFTTMFGLEKNPPQEYPYNGEVAGFWLTNMNPPLLYIIATPFLILKDILIGYTVAVFLSSLGISIVFLFIYRFTKDHIISLISSLLLAFNPAEIWYWQQGAWTSLIGVVLLPLGIWFLYDFLEGKCSFKRAILGNSLILLSYFVAIIPLIFSSIFYITFKRSYKNLINIIKIFLISLLIASPFLYASLFSRLSVSSGKTVLEEFEYLISPSTPTGGTLQLMPIWLYFLAAFGILLGIKFRKDYQILFFYFIGIFTMFLFSFIALKLNIPLTHWFTRLYVLLPQLCTITFGFCLVFIKKFFIPSKKLYDIVYKISLFVILIIFIYLMYPQLSFVVNRHAQMTDQKYDAIVWIRENTNEDSRVLFFNPYEFNGYDWTSLSYRNNKQLSFDEAKQTIESNKLSESYLDYDYVIITDFDMEKGSSFLDVSKSLFLNSGYKEVYSNDEVLILS